MGFQKKGFSSRIYNKLLFCRETGLFELLRNFVMYLWPSLIMTAEYLYKVVKGAEWCFGEETQTVTFNIHYIKEVIVQTL